MARVGQIITELFNRGLSPDVIGQVVDVLLAASPARQPAQEKEISDVIETVANETGITVAALCGHCRSARLVSARAVAAHRLRDAGLSLPRIGRAIGGRDHTTIMHCLRHYTPEGERVRG